MDMRTPTIPPVPEETPRDLIRYWRSAVFRARAMDWIHEVLGAYGRELPGTLRVHRVRFWSAVFTVQSDSERLWFKAANPGQRFEAPLLARLSQLLPDHVITPLAIDDTRGWLLLPDGGQTLRARGDVTIAEWEALVEQVAQMQAALTQHAADLIQTGLPALPPEQAGEYVAGLVDELAHLPATHPQRIDPDQARALMRGISGLSGCLGELAGSGTPLTLQPNDVSASNAFLPRDDGGPFRLFDFGDAFWSHPFAALQVPTRMVTGSWPLPPPPAHVASARLWRAYLQQWPQTSRRDDLAVLIDAADRLASLHRCESWRRLLARVDPEHLGVPPPRLADWLADAMRPLHVRS
jgi:hypothetical protein